MNVVLSKTERDYKDAAMSFAAYGGNANYPCYGLVEEAGELLMAITTNDDDHIVGELGDICWMVAAMCSELGISWEDVVSAAKRRYVEDSQICGAGDVAYAIVTIVANISGKIAKFIRKNEGLEPKVAAGWTTKSERVDEFRKAVSDMLSNVLLSVMDIGRMFVNSTSGTQFDLILQHNIDKLTERKETGTIVGSGETVEERKANAKKEAL